MESVFKGTFFLSANDADAEGRLSLTSLTSKIIDVATRHANSLGIGNPSMQHLHAGWILSRLTIGMDSYPEINNSFVIKTWIEDFNRHFSTRCFSIEAEDSHIFGHARSIWLVLDYENHSNYGTSHLSLSEEYIYGKDVPLSPQEKHVPIVEEGSKEAYVRKALTANRKPVNYTFKYCDLDYYRHVNTVRYVALLLNQFTLEEHDSSMIQRLELSFLHEASYGMDTLLLRHDYAEDGMHSAFQLSDTDNTKPLLFARVTRKKVSL